MELFSDFFFFWSAALFPFMRARAFSISSGVGWMSFKAAEGSFFIALHYTLFSNVQEKCQRLSYGHVWINFVNFWIFWQTSGQKRAIGPEFGQSYVLIPARVREKLCVDTDPNSGRNMYIGPEFGQIITISVKLCFHVFCATTTHMVVVLFAYVVTHHFDVVVRGIPRTTYTPHIPRICSARLF